MASKLFLEKLLLKLKTGNARSIHLNALPGRFARLDLYDLINVDQSLQLKFIRQLLSKTRFDLKISIDFKVLQKRSVDEVNMAKLIIKKLNSLFYQQQDEFLEHGSRTFAFGYPLLIKRDVARPEKILKAPLIIWYLDLQKDLHKSNTWRIVRNEDHPVIFNEVLRSYLETHEQIKIDDILPFLDDQIISEEELVNICQMTLNKLGTSSTEMDTELKVMPGTNRETIEKLTQNDPWIRWSGIFGLYKTQKQSIIKDVELLINEVDLSESETDDVIEKRSDNSPGNYSAVPLDPSQESILYGLKEKSKIIIQGPPGTGKSQSLTAVISDALAHGSNCLVVCEKKTALDVIYKNLAQVGLEDLCIVIDDVYRDRKKVVDKVRSLLERRDEPPLEFRHYEYDALKRRHQSFKHELSNHIASVNHKCFGDDTLMDLIANVHRQKNNTSWKPLVFVLNPPMIAANYDEYLRFGELVHKGSGLFDQLPAKLPYDVIHDKHFNDINSSHRLFPDLLFLLESIQRIEETFLQELPESGHLFNKLNNATRIRLFLGGLLPRYKRIKAARSFIISEYSILQELLTSTKYFEHPLPNIDQIDQMDDIRPHLKQLKDLATDLYSSREHFDVYSQWRRFIMESDKVAQVILYSLGSISSDVETDGWKDSYDIWYKEKFIQKYIDEHSISDGLDDMIDALTTVDDNLRADIPGHIRSVWDVKQKSLLQERTISGVKHLYNYRRNKKYGKRNSLRKIIHQDVDLFKTSFPVIMVNPVVCSSILPLQRDICDCVIFDEASQLRIEDTFAALIRGRLKIISGDKHQMPPSSYFMSNVVLMDNVSAETDYDDNAEITDDFLAESPSLLEYGMDTDYTQAFLDFHYRSQHPNLIAFSNAAFYGNRLVPMPPVNSIPPVAFYRIDGSYLKSRINQEEAEAVADYLLNSIRPVNDIYPSVGIATFNINQRNYIWDHLVERSYTSEAFAVQLDRLIERGLFVKNLENIQGDERDIILISTTFGPNQKGDFRQSFGPITQEKGYRLLNVIISRAKQQIAVFTSIPSKYITAYKSEIEEKGNTGKAIFYAYLAYVESVANDQLIRSKNILDLLSLHCREKPFSHELKGMPLFLQQIYSGLYDRYEQQIVHNYTFGGFLIELAVLHNDRPVLAILTSHSTFPGKTSYRMLLFKKNILRQHGIQTMVVDTVKWSQNWDVEEAILYGAIDAVL